MIRCHNCSIAVSEGHVVRVHEKDYHSTCAPGLGQAVARDEVERILAEYGTVSCTTATAALATLTHGKPEGWTVTSVGDEIHKDFGVYGPPREVGPRTRTITIELTQ